MFEIITNISSKKLYGFEAYADRVLKNVVKDGIEFGDRYMTGIVPRGETQRLASAVDHAGPVSVVNHVHVGTVGVNDAVAPYAGKVNRGTGVDGPSHSPYIVQRQSFKNPKRKGVVAFKKKGEPLIYRHIVKAAPSLKIQHGKNFDGRTYEAMKFWTRARTAILEDQFSVYFAGRHRE